MNAVNVHKAALWLGMSERAVTALCKAGRLEGAYQPAGYRGMWIVPISALKAITPTPAYPIPEITEITETT